MSDLKNVFSEKGMVESHRDVVLNAGGGRTSLKSTSGPIYTPDQGVEEGRTGSSGRTRTHRALSRVQTIV